MIFKRNSKISIKTKLNKSVSLHAESQRTDFLIIPQSEDVLQGEFRISMSIRFLCNTT